MMLTMRWQQSAGVNDLSFTTHGAKVLIAYAFVKFHHYSTTHLSVVSCVLMYYCAWRSTWLSIVRCLKLTCSDNNLSMQWERCQGLDAVSLLPNSKILNSSKYHLFLMCTIHGWPLPIDPYLQEPNCSRFMSFFSIAMNTPSHCILRGFFSERKRSEIALVMLWLQVRRVQGS